MSLLRKFKLDNSTKTKASLYSEDVGVIICKLFEDPYDGESTLQLILFWVMLLHTAGRPSTFVTTSNSAFYIQWEDFTLIPRRINGETIGFDTRVKLRNFKGHALGASSRIAKTVYLHLRTVRKDENIIFDIGSYLVAHGIRMQAFTGRNTVADVYAVKTRTLMYAPGMQKQPVFLAKNARGMGLERGRPYAYWAMSDDVRTSLDQAGIVGRFGVRSVNRATDGLAPEGTILGATSVRRGTATTLQQSFGATDARMILGHNPRSTVLETSYDEHRETLDIVGATAGEEEVAVERRVPLYLRR